MSNGLSYNRRNYVGTNAQRPPETWIFDRDPTPYDIHYSLLDQWLNSDTKGAFVLVSLDGTSYSKGPVAVWVPYSSCALALIQTQTAAAVATVSFTSGISNTYNNYLLLIDSVNCPTASSNTLLIQLSTDGGATWINTGYYSGSSTRIGLATGVTNLANGTTYLSGAITITNVTSGTGYTCTSGDNTTFDTNTLISSGANPANGVYSVAGTVSNAFRIIVDGTKVFSGSFSLYGYAK